MKETHVVYQFMMVFGAIRGGLDGGHKERRGGVPTKLAILLAERLSSIERG